MNKDLVSKDDFIRILFLQETPQVAAQVFDEFEYEPNTEISVVDCVRVLYPDELKSDDWKQMDYFVPQTSNSDKMIMRDLLDLGLIISCPDDLTAEDTCLISFLLLEKGMLCIVSEFFAVACSFVPGIKEYWDFLKTQDEVNLVHYLEKYADCDVNLKFMNNLL